MVKPVKDLLVSLSNGEKDLGNGRLFVVDKMWDSDKSTVHFSVKRRDVPIERNGGNFLLQSLFGLKAFSGKDELDRERNAMFRQDNVLVVSDMSPRMVLAFPDRFEDLPRALKDSEKWGIIFEMVYSAEDKIRSEIRAMKNSEMSAGEIWNTISSSPSKYFEKNVEMTKQLALLELERQGIKPQSPQAPMQIPNPMGGG